MVLPFQKYRARTADDCDDEIPEEKIILRMGRSALGLSASLRDGAVEQDRVLPPCQAHSGTYGPDSSNTGFSDPVSCPTNTDIVFLASGAEPTVCVTFP
jgi:hypothetical protein